MPKNTPKKITDYCKAISDQYSMEMQHQATHVLEWKYLIDEWQGSGAIQPVVIGRRAVNVMCLCGETFDINKGIARDV